MRLQRGDEAAYEQLVREHGGAMLAVARRLLRDEDAAREAVQSGFISAFRSIQTFRQDASLSTWLHRIVVNAALMHLRRVHRRPETSIEELLPVFDETGHHRVRVDRYPISAETRGAQHGGSSRTAQHFGECGEDSVASGATGPGDPATRSPGTAHTSHELTVPRCTPPALTSPRGSAHLQGATDLEIAAALLRRNETNAASQPLYPHLSPVGGTQDGDGSRRIPRCKRHGVLLPWSRVTRPVVLLNLNSALQRPVGGLAVIVITAGACGGEGD
jgi:RNA polymerase sigma factor (sigma-70 family)